MLLYSPMYFLIDQYNNFYGRDGDWHTDIRHAQHYKDSMLADADRQELQKQFGTIRILKLEEFD